MAISTFCAEPKLQIDQLEVQQVDTEDIVDKEGKKEECRGSVEGSLGSMQGSVGSTQVHRGVPFWALSPRNVKNVNILI